MAEINNPPQFTVWEAMVRASFFSGDLYRDVGRNWRGIALRLLLLVLAITWLAEGIKIHHSFNDFARNDFPNFIQDFPPITITNGVVSSPVEQPYSIKDHSSGKTFGILDTTGTITSLDDIPDAGFLVTQNKIHWRDPNNPGQTRIQDFSQIKNFYIDKAKLTHWVSMGAAWFTWIAIPIVFVFSLIYRLIQGLIYGAIGLIWNSALNARLTYAALVRLAFLSVTPVLLISTILFLTHVNIPLWTLICFVIEMVYLAMAVNANAGAPGAPASGNGYTGQPYPYQQPFPPNPPTPPYTTGG